MARFFTVYALITPCSPYMHLRADADFSTNSTQHTTPRLMVLFVCVRRPLQALRGRIRRSFFKLSIVVPGTMACSLTKTGENSQKIGSIVFSQTHRFIRKKLISPLHTATWKHKTHPPRLVSLLHLLGQNRMFLYWFYTQPYMAICGIFRYVRKKTPPVREKTFRRLQNHRFSKSKHILIQQKRFERKSSSQLWERRFWKCPRWFSVKYVGWRFFTKTPKIVRFTNSDKIFDSNLFIGPEIHYILRISKISRHCSSFFVIFCLSGGAEKARKIPENEQ